MWRSFHSLVAVLVAAAYVACDDSTGPRGSVPLSLSFTTAPPLGGASPALMDVTIAEGGNTLVIRGAEFVLREVEFERTEAVADCDVPEGEDTCEEVEAGPFLVGLPLSGSPQEVPVVVLETSIPEGSYDEVEFDVHKLGGGDPVLIDAAGEAFPTDVSIRVGGTWDDGSGPVGFTFTSDLDEEQEYAFSPPIVADAVNNVTLRVDVRSWFRDASGALINPETANKGGINEQQVTVNIRASIEAFEDDDHDGVED